MMTQLLLAHGDHGTVTLEPAGMAMMALSILLVTGLTVFCAARILREKNPADHHHAPLDIDTHDLND